MVETYVDNVLDFLDDLNEFVLWDRVSNYTGPDHYRLSFALGQVIEMRVSKKHEMRRLELVEQGLSLYNTLEGAL